MQKNTKKEMKAFGKLRRIIKNIFSINLFLLLLSEHESTIFLRLGDKALWSNFCLGKALSSRVAIRTGGTQKRELNSLYND